MQKVASIFSIALIVCVTARATAPVDPAVQPSQKIVAPATEPNWRPTRQQEELIDTVTRDYFAARDGGRHEDAYSRLSARHKQ